MLEVVLIFGVFITVSASNVMQIFAVQNCHNACLVTVDSRVFFKCSAMARVSGSMTPRPKSFIFRF